MLTDSSVAAMAAVVCHPADGFALRHAADRDPVPTSSGLNPHH